MKISWKAGTNPTETREGYVTPPPSVLQASNWTWSAGARRRSRSKRRRLMRSWDWGEDRGSELVHFARPFTFFPYYHENIAPSHLFMASYDGCIHSFDTSKNLTSSTLLHNAPITSLCHVSQNENTHTIVTASRPYWTAKPNYASRSQHSGF
jgi:hypothetical protein